MPTKLICALLAGFFLQVISFSLHAQEKTEGPLKLNELIAEALAKNPEVIAAWSRWSVLKERPSQAGALDDPMVGLGVVNLPTNTFSFRDEDMTMKEFSLSQRLPYPGKRGLRSEIAQKEAETALIDYEEVKVKVSREVRMAYFELLYVNKAIQVTEKNREILKLLNQIAETKYSVGEGIHTDVFKAQVELSKMIDELITLNQNKRTLKSKLNTLLYRPAFAPLGDPGEMEFGKFAADPEDLIKRAEEKRPSLLSAKKMIERNQAGLKLAERDYYPDFDLRFAYGQRDDGPMGKRADMVSGMVAFNIPVWYRSKQERKVAEARKDIQSAKDQLAAMTNEIRYTISEKLTDIERAEKQAELLKTGIIPLASLSLDSAIASYRVNKVDFITMLDSLMTLFRYEIQYYRQQADHQKSVAEIESAIGKSSAEEPR